MVEQDTSDEEKVDPTSAADASNEPDKLQLEPELADPASLIDTVPAVSSRLRSRVKTEPHPPVSPPAPAPVLAPLARLAKAKSKPKKKYLPKKRPVPASNPRTDTLDEQLKRSGLPLLDDAEVFESSAARERAVPGVSSAVSSLDPGLPIFPRPTPLVWTGIRSISHAATSSPPSMNNTPHTRGYVYGHNEQPNTQSQSLDGGSSSVVDRAVGGRLGQGSWGGVGSQLGTGKDRFSDAAGGLMGPRRSDHGK